MGPPCTTYRTIELLVDHIEHAVQDPLPVLFSFQHHWTLLALAAGGKGSLDLIAISLRLLVFPVSVSDLSFDGAIPSARSAWA